MNYYIVGDTSSVFIKDFVSQVLKPIDNKKVFIIGEDSNAKEYEGSWCAILDIKGEPKKGFASIFRGWCLCREQIKKGGAPYAFQIHFVNPWIIIKYYPLWKKSHKRVLTFWGSDLYCMKKTNRILMKFLLPSATDIIVMENNMKREFERLFG